MTIRVECSEWPFRTASRSLGLDAEAGQLSAEVARRGIAANARMHVLVEVLDGEADALPMAAIAQAGDAFDWIADEPDLDTDADLVEPRAVQASFGRACHALPAK